MIKQKNINNKKEKISGKIIAQAFSEIFLMLLSTFAFAFIIGGMAVGLSENASAADSASTQPSDTSWIPQGCCVKSKDGSVCQNMNLVDKAECQGSLLQTDCNFVSGCEKGCCYSRSEGICSLNSPKEKCEANGGSWSANAECSIPECQLGCCVLADQASITTIRECTLLSNRLRFTPNFQPIDADGTCNSKTGLEKKGACLTPSPDFSGENNCKFEKKSQCASGIFYENYLCTAEFLNTTCYPARNTTCLPDSDQIYFLDTCGNPANIYDASKFNNKAYWEKIVPRTASCSPASSGCGNCDYMTGSVCKTYRPGKDTKPEMGNNICRNLNCLNGRKHGESWCIKDYRSSSPAVAPVGSRFFRGVCLNGEITIEPCADFNQEICIENTYSVTNSAASEEESETSSENTEQNSITETITDTIPGSPSETSSSTTTSSPTFSEAACRVNNWRSCLAANDKETYDEIKAECDNYPDDCIMFLDIPGNNIYADLPGFKKIANSEQGAAGEVGKDTNKIVTHCVPKYTPGMVFWNNPSSSQISPNSASAGSSSQTPSAGNNYGGTLEETSLICAQGSFTCTSHREQHGWGNWQDVVNENPECNIDSAGVYNAKVPMLVNALNERCRSLGPCGLYVNIAEKFGSNNITNSTIKRTYIDESGTIQENRPITGYNFTSSYLTSLADRASIIRQGSLASLTGAVIATITGRAFAPPAAAITEAPTVTAPTSGSLVEVSVTNTPMPINPGPPLNVPVEGSLQTLETAGGWGALTWNLLLDVAMAAYAGYIVGGLIGKWAGWDPAQVGSLSNALAAGAGAAVAMHAIFPATTGTVWSSTWLAAGLWGLAVAIIAFAISELASTEDRYYTMTYTCEPWSAPRTGNCKSCNNDIRTCSEYRCRSLGQNCQYFNSNGEPGYCTTLDDIWSATISPWPEALTEGNSYADVAPMSFKITGSRADGKVEAWTSIQFGIITDKPAQCRIDTAHTDNFDAMSTSMAIDSEVGCVGSACAQGTHHKIALSSYINTGESGTSTLSLAEGENTYYMRCRNFAGQTNSAEFAVRVIVGPGPDLTPPIIKSFSPESGSYAKMGANSTQISFLVSEPATCRYSQDSDNRFEDMTGRATCMTSAASANLGEWPCYATFTNLNKGDNKFYFQCADQPNIEERRNSSRNINRNSKVYTVNVCSTGLNITSVSPEEKIIAGKSPVPILLEAETSGCIAGGRATCYFKFPSDPAPVAFFNTNSRMHSQPLTNMPAASQNISIICQDEAGNTAFSSVFVNITLDNKAPEVSRMYILNQKVVIVTNERATCSYSSNSTTGCDFNLGNTTQMEDNGLFHSAPWLENKNYFVRCADVYNNTSPCAVSINA